MCTYCPSRATSILCRGELSSVIFEAFETIEWYCTVSSHLETYNDLHHKVWKSFSCGTRIIIPDGDILHVVFVPPAQVRLPVFSVRKGFHL